jgi:hypothetical protein
MKYKHDFRTEAVLSIHHAMLDLVTPELRAVTYSAVFPSLDAIFFLEKADEENVDIVDEIETLVMADFLEPVNVSIRAMVLTSDEPRVLPEGHTWLYARREPNDPI